MNLKKIAKNLVLAGGMLLGAEKCAKADDIKLSCDYFENKKNMVTIENTVFAMGTADSKQLILGSKDYGDLITDANKILHSNSEKIELLGHLGAAAGNNYDFSRPNQMVSPQYIFAQIKQSISTGKPESAGAICGGIHNFIKTTAQQLGFDAVTYSGRFGKKGTPHVFASIYDLNEGFVDFNYGQITHTRTNNFYRALVLGQRIEGADAFMNYVYDDEFLFANITPDGKRFLNFINVDPSLESLIAKHNNGIDQREGGHVVLSNAELSGEYVLGLKGVSFGIKGGRMFGQTPSALRSADLLEGAVRLAHADDKFYFDFRIGSTLGFFNLVDTNNTAIMFFQTVATGFKVPVTEEIKVGAGIEQIAVIDLDLTNVYDSIFSDVFGQRISLANIKTIWSVDYKDLSSYIAVEFLGVVNNVQEQRFTFELGDIESGIIYDCKDIGKFKVAGKIKTTAYAPYIGFDNKYFGAGLSYGLGRQGVFTPDYLEANARFTLPLLEREKNSKNSKKEGIGLSLESNFSLRREQWSHDELYHSGKGELMLKLDF